MGIATDVPSMIALLGLLAVTGQAGPAAAQSPASQLKAKEQKVVSRVKRLSVAQLDTDLADEPYEEWLRGVTGAEPVTRWQVTGCDLMGQTPGGSPVCVTSSTDVPKVGEVRVHIKVGTVERGYAGAPTLWRAEIFGTLAYEYVPAPRLGALPGALAEMRRLCAKGPCD